MYTALAEPTNREVVLAYLSLVNDKNAQEIADLLGGVRGCSRANIGNWLRLEFSTIHHSTRRFLLERIAAGNIPIESVSDVAARQEELIKARIEEKRSAASRHKHPSGMSAQLRATRNESAGSLIASERAILLVEHAGLRDGLSPADQIAMLEEVATGFAGVNLENVERKIARLRSYESGVNGQQS